MSNEPIQMHIDGKWIRCLPAEDYGFLGARLLADLGKSPGQPKKKLLLRYSTWPHPGSRAADLGVNVLSDRAGLGLRAPAVKKYHQAVKQGDGTQKQEACAVYQQDITGLLSLKGAILRAVKDREPQRIWHLFFNACSALDSFGKAAAVGGGVVPLQCPSSLAVGPQDRVVALDGEFILNGGVGRHPESSQAYGIWFGNDGANGFADPTQASFLHANALLAYFRQLLEGLYKQAAPGDQAALAKVLTSLGQAPAGQSLGDLEDWVRGNSEDWGIHIDGDPQVGVVPVTAAADRDVRPARQRRSVLLQLSLLLNLALAAAVVVLVLLRPRAGAIAASNDPVPEGGSTLLFSSNNVVFPTQGTLADKVSAALQELYPGKVLELRRAGADHERLLREKMDESIKSVREPERLKQLLGQLAADHSVRFKGFVAGESGGSLEAVIERGGVFTISTPLGQQHGSLLQSNGLEKVLHQSNMHGQPEPRALLASLKSAVGEYASLKDALSVIGERNAFVLRVEPTAVAHEEMRRRLLSRLEKPVFVSRPVFELFDAVDPTADTGGGSAFYTLRLDRKCHWRLGSREDRERVDFAKNTSNDRMKWQAFEAGKTIEWKPIPVTKRNGRTDPVSSFDVAVLLEGKVAVFRNQSLMVGDSRKQIIDQGRRYISEVLKLNVQAVEDAISVRVMGDQYTGTLIYSYLAEQVSPQNSGAGREVELFDNPSFQQVLRRENEF